MKADRSNSLSGALAIRIYQDISRQFPVCCASDEFYFFPQVVADSASRWDWDDFSAPAIDEFAARSRRWQGQLEVLKGQSVEHADQVDIELLLGMLTTLREQLQLLAPQRRQPSFYLMIVVAGLGEALESSDPLAWQRRIAGLPDFLRRAGDVITEIPQLFLAVAQKMAADIRQWLKGIEGTGIEIGESADALLRFSQALTKTSTRNDFALPAEQFERLLMVHLCCEADPAAIEQELLDEQAEMKRILTTEAKQLPGATPWQAAEPAVPFQSAPGGDLKKLYRPLIGELENHTRTLGLIPPLSGGAGLELAEVPASMAAVRASDAYNARPGHPASGGTFYLYHEQQADSTPVGRTLEYRLTAAHETWPGHHLLDICRWNLPRAVRRPLERPLFYEGWACFSEQLMADTGYFDGPWDRFLLARRRIERATRGLVDIGLQAGTTNIEQACQLLTDVGYTQQKASEVVPKYALRPGYQVCYTYGLRRLLQLRKTFSALDIGVFARKVLSEGEIGFSTLTRILQNDGG